MVDECGRFSKPNQCYFWYTAWLKRLNFTCAAVDKISADIARRAVPLRDLSLLWNSWYSLDEICIRVIFIFIETFSLDFTNIAECVCRLSNLSATLTASDLVHSEDRWRRQPNYLLRNLIATVTSVLAIVKEDLYATLRSQRSRCATRGFLAHVNEYKTYGSRIENAGDL